MNIVVCRARRYPSQGRRRGRRRRLQPKRTVSEASAP
jgi:hypothetical protein